MTPEQFTYWLQGFIEVENPKTLNLRQTKIIKDHLELVFKKETPNRNSRPSRGGSLVVC
jgi:hypothetical protein